MARFACVDVIQFSLQMVLAAHPGWADEPVAVVDRLGDRGTILDCNRHGESGGIERGMHFGQAAALVPALRAATVDDAALADKSDQIASSLRDFSPRVERRPSHPGVFWLEITGLDSLYKSWRHWGEMLRDRLINDHDVYTAVVIGFTRFGTFAAARSTAKSGVFDSPESERSTAFATPLHRLELPPRALKTAARLGMGTVADLLRLPVEGLRRRFGNEVFELVRTARGDLDAPAPAARPADDPRQTDRLNRPETNHNRLLFLIKRQLTELVETLRKQGEKITALTLLFRREDDDPLQAQVRPAAPTADTGLLADLVRLRLERICFSAAITGVDVTARGQRVAEEQMQLFSQGPDRDLEAANRALARIRAELGADTVMRLQPAEGHLPRSRFELKQLDELALPAPEPTDTHPAIRRFFLTPRPLSGRPPPTVHAGPHVVDGGWWIRRIRRDYRLAGADNQLLWVFYDHRRGGWYLQGEY